MPMAQARRQDTGGCACTLRNTAAGNVWHEQWCVLVAQPRQQDICVHLSPPVDAVKGRCDWGNRMKIRLQCLAATVFECTNAFVGSNWLQHKGYTVLCVLMQCYYCGALVTDWNHHLVSFCGESLLCSYSGVQVVSP
eukprot:GHRR01024086.1.p1 GENE.GHRR01024086.1~~GHRR01024086.1.p1  ORF type:complete len:137 (-),score=14.23 GHRR01024086.1:328-738(-)